LGDKGNLLSNDPLHARYIHLDQPVLNEEDFGKIKYIHHDNYKSGKVDLIFVADEQKGRLKAALDHICATAEDLARNNTNIIILSDRNAGPHVAPVPSLLAAGAVHHHLIKRGLRNATSIVVEAGDIWETHHFATLIGYGVNAIHPF